MIHVVSAGAPFAAGKPDFLVNDQPDPLSIPDTIYLSNGSTGLVSVVAAANITGTISPGNLSVQLDAQMPQFSRQPKEPRYMGKTLGEWIEEARPTLATTTNTAGQRMKDLSLHNQKELQGALRMLGSNAVPALIAILDQSESVVTGTKLKALRTPRLPQALKTKFAGDLQATHQELGFVNEALRFLGDDALHAIPDLERIVCEPNRSIAPRFAASALANLGFVPVPALLRCLTNAPADRHRMIQQAITPLYIRDLRSTNLQAQTVAALVLVDTPNPPFEIIHALAETLDNPDVEIRRRALDGLTRHLPTLAPSLVVAYRAVEKLTTSDDPEMCRVATELLAKLTANAGRSRRRQLTASLD